MANETIRARIEVLLKGLDQVESLKNAVRQLQTTAAPASADLQKLKNAAMQLGSASGRTENDLRRSISALKDVRAQLSLTDREYQKLTGTINKYQAQLDRATGAQQQGGRGMRFAQAAGAVAASGVFGGPEGFIGAALGSFGGPGGALAGGAIGAQLGMVRQQIGATSDYAAQIDKLKIALKGVTQTSQEYEAALRVINQATTSFNVARDEAISGFTKLAASVIGAGGKVRDAEIVFNGVSAAIRATGGSAEDVQGALTAMAQVFSKGKATAEEVQGQLGERLPGAVTLFAQATGRTGAELAKAFEQGTVGLNDVMKFAIALGDKFAKTNEKIASSSESAGDRMKIAFASLREEFGRTFQPLGAAIQDATADLAGFAAEAIKTARNSSELNAALAEATKNSMATAKAMEEMRKSGGAGVDGGIGDAILQLASGAGELETKLRKTDTQLQASIARFYEAEGAVINHRKALLASGQTLDEQGKVINAADGALKILEGRLRTLAAQNKGNTKEAEFYRAKVAELKGVLESVRGTYKAKIEIEQIFKGQGQQVNRGGKGGIPEGYRVVAGKLAYQVPGVGWVDAQTGKPVFAGTAPNGTTNFPSPSSAKTGEKDTAAEKARAAAERAAAEQQRLNEAVAKAQIQLAQTVFNNQIELIKKRYDYEDERIQAQRDIRAGALEGERSEVRRSANEFLNRLDELRRGLREKTLAVVVAEQTAAFNARMEAVTAQGLGGAGGGTRIASGGNAIFGSTGNVSNAPGWVHGHMQSFGTASELVLAATDVVQKLLAQGIKVYINGVGDLRSNMSEAEIRAAVERGRKAHTHSGDGRSLDVFVPRGTAVPVPLAGVGSMGARGGVGGTIAGTNVAIMHLDPSSRAGGATGVAAQTRRNVAAAGKAGSSSEEVANAQRLLDIEKQRVDLAIRNDIIRSSQAFTQSLRNEANAMENANKLALERMRLEQSGMRPELVEMELKLLDIQQKRTDKETELKALIEENKDDPDAVEKLEKDLEGVNAAYDRQAAAIRAIAEAQTAAGVALKNRIGQLRQELAQLTNMENFIVTMSQTIESSLSTAISSAVTNMVTGAQSIKQTLADMFASIGKAFIDMAAQIIAKQLIMVALNRLLGLFGGGGFSFSGAGPVSGASVFGSGQAAFNPAAFTGGFSFANGGVMSNVGPLPLKRYAGGGVANSPQMAVFGERGPEAYVPLPDGRSIPVKMKQRNEAINRYRPMGAMGTVTESGDSGAAAATGGIAGASAIDVRYTVERINNVEYVTAEQFQQGMRQAAIQGAHQGERQTLRRIQQSATTRKRIGI